MNITHLAYNFSSPEETEAAKDHYERFYGLRYLGTRDRRGLLTMDLTDGTIAIALTHYQPHAPQIEATAAGPAPSFHHIGFDVDEFEARSDDVIKAEYDLFSKPGQIPIKFRAPGGTVAEFAPSPFFSKRATHKTPVPIKHLALRLATRDDVDAASDYYQHTWGFKPVGTRDRRGLYTHDLSDGNLAFALTVFEGDDQNAVKSNKTARPPCIHHIGFEVDNFEERVAKINDLGFEQLCEQGQVPFKYVAPGGTMAEFAPKGYFQELGASA
jgi:lactoylglutathione lyase